MYVHGHVCNTIIEIVTRLLCFLGTKYILESYL
jgi:hypothetical protein